MRSFVSRFRILCGSALSARVGRAVAENLSDLGTDDFELADDEGVTFSPAVETPPGTPRYEPDSMASRLVSASATAISAATADQNIQEQQPLHSGLFLKLAILVFKVVK